MANQIETTVENPVENESNARSVKNIIKAIIMAGGNKISNLVVKNVNCGEKFASDGGVFTNFSLSVDKSIPAFVTDEATGVRGEGKLPIVYVSDYALAGTLREDINLAWLGSYFIEHPQSAKLILSGATIDIVQQRVPAGEAYINPFTTKTNPEPTFFEEDKIINHVIGIRLSKVGENWSNKAAEMILNK